MDEPAGSVTEDALDQLRLATREALAVRVVYVSADGSPTERELAPLDLKRERYGPSIGPAHR